MATAPPAILTSEVGAAVSDGVRVEICASFEVDGASVEASGALVAEAPQANKPKTTAITGKANIRDIFRDSQPPSGTDNRIRFMPMHRELRRSRPG